MQQLRCDPFVEIDIPATKYYNPNPNLIIELFMESEPRMNEVARPRN